MHNTRNYLQGLRKCARSHTFADIKFYSIKILSSRLNVMHDDQHIQNSADVYMLK